MSDLSPDPQFEKEIRDCLSTPQPSPEFVKTLQTRLLQQASPPSQRARRPFFLRLAWLAPVALVLIVIACTLIIGPQRVWAAVTGLFSYLPDIGLVRNNGSLRVLAEPIQQVQDGITLKVQQGAADDQHTVIVYQADGLSMAAANSQGEGAATGGPAALLLPDGSILSEQGSSSSGWGTGYQARLTFPPLSASVQGATLLIARLQSMPAGAAPEDWRIPIHFKPAPADLHGMPVYELSTPSGLNVSQGSTQPALSVPAQSVPTNAALSNVADQNGVRFSLDRVIDQGDGFMLEGSAAWDANKNTSVSFDPFGTGSYSLVDANGQIIPFEEAQSDNGGSSNGQGFTWALRTNNKNYPGPWKLTVPSLLVYQQIQGGQAAFVVDYGSDPQVGQTWQIDQEIGIFNRKLRLVSARLSQDPRSQSLVMDLVLTGDPDLVGISLEDPQNVAGPGEGAGGGGGGGPSPTDVPGTLRTSFPYYQKPAGTHRIEVSSLSYTLNGPWQVAWTPPLIAAAGAVPTQPAPACLTLQKWQQLKNQPAAALPAELSGRLLLENDTGQLMPQLSLADPGGAHRQELAIGGWSALSPDGARVAFVSSNGPSLFVQDIQTGNIRPIPGTVAEDYHAMWSPDGQWIAFVRSLSGIYAIHPDGSGLTRVTTSATLSFLVGWLPDNRTLVITTLGAGGSQVQTVDIQTRKVQDEFMIKNAKGAFARISPDGTRLAFSENTFGLPSYGVYVANLDGSEKRLVAGLEAGAASIGAWSPDGKWLAVTISDYSGSQTSESLVAVQPDTCQAAILPGLAGQVTDWR